MNWTLITQNTPNDVFLKTAIIENGVERNVQYMKRSNNLWWCKDGTYVYYTPTHYER